MLPIKLRMAGLRSYRTERVIEFGNPGLVAVIGDTGAGKSSILEGITGGLYGSCTWDGRGLGELISDGVQTLQLELTFSVDGHTWTVSRSASRRNYPPSKHHLHCHDTGENADGERAVSERVVALLGLDRQQFLRVVVLPQNRFMELLTARRTERNTILKGIFRLDDLDQIRLSAEALLSELDPRLTDARVARAKLAPDPAAALAGAEQRRATAQAQRDQLRNVHGRVSDHLRAAENLRNSAAEVGRNVERVTTALTAAGDVDAALLAAGSAAVDLDAAAADLAFDRQRLTQQHTRAQSALDAAAIAGEDAAVLAAALQTLASLDAAVPALAADHLELSAEDSRIATDADALEVLRRLQQTKAEEVAAAKRALSPLQEEAAEAADARELAHAMLTTLADAYVAATTSATRVDAIRSTLVATRASARLTAEEVRQATTAADAADAALQELRRRNAAAHAAAECKPGDPCPVCDRPLPETFTPSASVDDDAARTRLGERRTKAEQLNRAASTAAEKARRAADDLAGAIGEETTHLVGLADAAADSVAALSAVEGGQPTAAGVALAVVDLAGVRTSLAGNCGIGEPAAIRASASDLASTPTLDTTAAQPAARNAAADLLRAARDVATADVDHLLAPLIRHAEELRDRCSRASGGLDALTQTVATLQVQQQERARAHDRDHDALAAQRERLLTDANRVACQLTTLPSSAADLATAAALVDVPVASLCPALATPGGAARIGDRIPAVPGEVTVSLPDDSRGWSAAAFTAAVAAVTARLKDAHMILEGHRRDLRAAREGLTDLAGREERQAADRDRLIAGPVRRAAAALQTIRTRTLDLQTALAAVTSDGSAQAAAPDHAARVKLPEPANDSAVTAEAVTTYRSAVAELLTAVDAIASAGQETIAALTDSAAAAQAAATRLLAGHALADLAALERAEIDAATRQEMANREAHRARAEQPVAAALDAGIGEATAALGVLREVRKALSSAKFVDFVIGRRSTALLRVASTLLGQLSAGGYGFAEDFKIIDRRAGSERDVKTLSGGETFLASLALALALVELAGRSGGRVDSLFLDEGFGSLDAAILAEALDVLRGHVATGRLVTVISHLHAVAADLDRVLLIIKSPGGSDLRWLEPAEREKLLLDDVSAGLTR
jgi:DNA repair protein SbcC/Rad50